MELQLVLIEERGADYKLDDRTREVGRRGIAAAREALRHGAAADVAGTSATTQKRRGRTAA